MYTNKSDGLRYAILPYTSQRSSMVITRLTDQERALRLINALQPPMLEIRLDECDLETMIPVFSGLIESRQGLIDILTLTIYYF
jgi:hypothetical protein